jgi:hypothetical protein
VRTAPLLWLKSLSASKGPSGGERNEEEGKRKVISSLYHCFDERERDRERERERERKRDREREREREREAFCF